MILFIDTSSSEHIVIGLDDVRLSTEARNAKSQKLLPFIEEKLAERGKTLHDVSEIEVNQGPGSFTGLRVGIAVANALGWALNIRVNTKEIAIDGPIEPVY